jgi:hypothetical protein
MGKVRRQKTSRIKLAGCPLSNPPNGVPEKMSNFVLETHTALDSATPLHVLSILLSSMQSFYATLQLCKSTCYYPQVIYTPSDASSPSFNRLSSLVKYASCLIATIIKHHIFRYQKSTLYRRCGTRNKRPRNEIPSSPCFLVLTSLHLSSKMPLYGGRQVVYFLIQETTQTHENGFADQVRFLFHVSIKSTIIPKVLRHTGCDWSKHFGQ